MKKKILGVLLLTFVFFVGIFNVNALTKEETIANKVVDIHWYFDYFEEGELPSIEEIGWYAITYDSYTEQSGDKYADYIIDDKQNDYTLYRVPAEIIENTILDTFEVDEEFLIEFRSEFKNIDPNNTNTYKYVEYDGKYYYEFGTIFGLGGSDSIDRYSKIIDLGNNYYQVNYYYAVFEDELEYEKGYVKPENPIEGVDYVMSCKFWETTCETKGKYFIIKEFSSKVHFVDNKAKLLSRELVKDRSVSSNKEINFLEGANQKFDVSKDKNLTFRIDAEYDLFNSVYVDDKEVDSKNYTVKSGSTIIIFNDEYTKQLKNGSHTLKVTFTDGESTTTTFEISTEENIENPPTGVFESFGIIAIVVLIISVISFIKVRKYSKFPQV